MTMTTVGIYLAKNVFQLHGVDQQALLSLHRASFIKTQTAQINQIRGLLTEFGIVLPIGKVAIHKHVPTILEDAGNALPDTFRQVLSRLYDHLTELSGHIDQSLKAHFKHCELSQSLCINTYKAGLGGF